MKYRVGMKLKRVYKYDDKPFAEQCNGVVIRKVVDYSVHLTDGTIWSFNYMANKFIRANPICLGGE